MELSEARAKSRSPERPHGTGQKTVPLVPRQGARHREEEGSPVRRKLLEHLDPELADLQASPMRRQALLFEREAAAAAGSSRGGASSSTSELSGVARTTVGDVPNVTPFSVLPVDDGAAFYHPVPWSAVDRGIAAFSNTRHCKVLFTRLDDNDHYIYGRLLVHCSLLDNGCGREEVYVSVADSNYLALGTFVELHEDAEHSHFERIYSAMEQSGPRVHHLKHQGRPGGQG